MTTATPKISAIRTFAMMVPFEDDSPHVERPAPGAAPTAFRIFKAGRNDSDSGPTFFTEASAQKLMAEQEARDRRLSMDFDHLSLRPDRPATSGRASGWNNLEVRRDAEGGPELWAITCEWCADTKAGLEARPPHWKFFSPAFRTDADGEVVSYTNTALCINPLTHQLPSLASATVTKDTTMSMKAALLAALAAMTKADASEDEKQAASKTLGEYLEGVADDDKKDAPPGEKKDAEPPCPPAKDDKPAEKKDAEPPPPPPPAKDDKPEDKKEAKAAPGDTTEKRIAALEIGTLLAGRTDLSQSIRHWCETQTDVSVVRSYLNAQPKPQAPRSDRATQGFDAGGVHQLTGAERAAMDDAMGVRRTDEKPFERMPDGTFVMRVVKPTEFRAAQAAKGGK